MSSSPGLLVGVDVGTTSCKAVALRPDGSTAGAGRRPTPWMPAPTGAEIDPFALVATAVGAAEDAVTAAGGRAIGLGVASFGETGFLLDRRGEPLANGIAWHDRRGRREAELLGTALGVDRFVRTTALPVSQAWSIAKYAHLLRWSPGTEKGVRWLSAAEWVVRCLGGEEVAEPSLASRTGFLDVAAGRWWDDALQWAGAPRDLLPELAPAGTPEGRVAASAALSGAVLTVAGHDHPCAGVGVGATGTDDVLDSCGTAEAVLREIRQPVAPELVEQAIGAGLTLGWHAAPGRRVAMGFFEAGRAFERWLGLLGIEPVGQRRTELDAGTLGVLDEPLQVVVYDLDHGPADPDLIGDGTAPTFVWRAVIEAGARRTAEIVAEIDAIAGGAAQRIVVTGGWSRSPAIRAVKRRQIGPFATPDIAEPGARGAALFAGSAAGVFGGVADFPPPAVAATNGSGPGSALVGE